MFSLFISFIACSEYAFHSPTNLNHRPEDELNGFTDGLTEEVATGTETPVSYTVEFAERYEASIELEVSSVDIAFALDTTCSMSEEAAALAREFSDIVDSLSESIPDAAYGFATFDDYNFYGLGSSSDRPFSLHNQITTDLPWIQYSLNYITIHNGEDVPESSMEALYQSLTGLGYNQSGEGVFNPGSDVPPFIAQAGDAFGGTHSGSFNPAVPGTGTIGGFGFREGSLPVIVYATDAPMRDADLGDTTPGAVSNPAGSTDVVHASDDLGARLIGISTQSTAPMSQMNDLALRTGSLYDADGEGINNDPLVFHWTGSSEAFRNT
ncbi:MAG: hypothetical protein VX278_14155, partial [Myxococcota bacterium]|nr:hypothetical protein [Myxococcota bacterium]